MLPNLQKMYADEIEEKIGHYIIYPSLKSEMSQYQSVSTANVFYQKNLDVIQQMFDSKLNTKTIGELLLEYFYFYGYIYEVSFLKFKLKGRKNDN